MSPSARRAVLRRCVACRALRDRRDLWRLIRLAEGGLALDQGMGRSAYLCPTSACLEEARRRRRLQKGLRCPVPDSVLDRLGARLATGGGASAEAR
ncbi:MAG: YlxR family protein [Cyanobium sp.]